MYNQTTMLEFELDYYKLISQKLKLKVKNTIKVATQYDIERFNESSKLLN